MAPMATDQRSLDSPELWEEHRNLIRDLYQGRGTLLHTRQILIDQHNFPHLPLSVYENRIRSLGLRKKLRRGDWLPVWLHCRAIQINGKTPLVLLHDVPLPWRKVWKEIRREKAHLFQARLGSNLPPLPPGVVVVDELQHGKEWDKARYPSTVETITPSEQVGSVTQVSTPTSVPNTLTHERTHAIPARCPEPGEAIFSPRCTANIAKLLLQTGSWTAQKTTRLANLPILLFLQSSKFDSTQMVGYDALKAPSLIDPSMSALSLLRVHDDTTKVALAPDGDAFRIFAMAIFRFSNNLSWHRSSWKDRHLVNVMFNQLPNDVLRHAIRSGGSSIKAAWPSLLTVLSDQDQIGPLLLLSQWQTSADYHLQKHIILALTRVGQHEELQTFLHSIADFNAVEKSVANAFCIAIERSHRSCVQVLAQWFLHGVTFERMAVLGREVESFWPLAMENDKRAALTATLQDYNLLQNAFSGVFRQFIPPRPGSESDAITALQQIGLSFYSAISTKQIRESPSGHWWPQYDDLLMKKRAVEVSVSIASPTLSWNFVAQFISDRTSLLVDSPWMLTALFLGAIVAPAVLFEDEHGESKVHMSASRQQIAINTVVGLFSRLGPSPALVDAFRKLGGAGMTVNSEGVALAASIGGLETLRLLLKLDVGVCRTGSLALAIAARRKDEPVTAWLLECGVDVNDSISDDLLTTRDALTIVYTAVCASPSDFVTRKDRATWDGVFAEQGAPFETLRLLKEKGAILRRHAGDLNSFGFWRKALPRILNGAQDVRSETIALLEEEVLSCEAATVLLDGCAEAGDWELYEYLRKAGVPTSKALVRAASSDLPEPVFTELLREAISINYQDEQLRTALHEACRSLNTTFVSLLLGLGSSPNVQDCSGHTPLHEVCLACPLTGTEATCQVNIALLLLQSGADFNAKTEDQITPLAAAATKGNLELAIHLLDHGAEPAGVALVGAAKSGRLDMVQLLLNAGARYQDQECEKAVGAASKANYYEVATLILNFKGWQSDDSFLPHASRGFQQPIAQYTNGPPDQAPPESESPSHFIATLRPASSSGTASADPGDRTNPQPNSGAVQLTPAATSQPYISVPSLNVPLQDPSSSTISRSRGPKLTYCVQCDKDFKTTSNYGKHMRSAIHGADHHHCPEANCGRTYIRRDALMNHVREVHPGSAHIKPRRGYRPTPGSMPPQSLGAETPQD